MLPNHPVQQIAIFVLNMFTCASLNQCVKLEASDMCNYELKCSDI